MENRTSTNEFPESSTAITADVNERDYVTAHVLACRKIESTIKRILVLVLLCGLLSFFLSSWETGLRIMLAVCGAYAGHLLQYRVYVPWKARRLFTQTRDRIEGSLYWDSDNLHFSSLQAQAAIRWDSIIKARENDEVMILYFNDAQFQIVAKRWFDKEGDLASFRTHLHFVH
jgi:hypothetical protein